MSSPHVFAFLKARILPHKLSSLAQKALFTLLGPGPFSAESADHILLSFDIPKTVLNNSIYNTDQFPKTRAYLQSSPIEIWRWILRRFGPSHGISLKSLTISAYTIASFIDSLSRAEGNNELHELHDVFVDAGVRFTRECVKILACRLLHAGMSRNAVHLFQAMRNQVLRDVARDYGAARRWKAILLSQVLRNDAWLARMGSVQAVVINGPTADGLEFLQIANGFVEDLEGLLESYEIRRGLMISRRASSGDIARRSSFPMVPPNAPPVRASFSDGMRKSFEKARGLKTRFVKLFRQ